MLKLTIPYTGLRKIAKSTPELFEALKKTSGEWGYGGPGLIEELLEDKGYYDFTAFVNDVEALPPEILKEASFEGVPALKLVRENGESCSGLDLKQAMQTHQVHLPGNELMRITEVFVEEDCCTERLQEHLTGGFRIIAVIPRAGQRRPDYVLGKN